MISYFLKSGACLALLLFFYHLVLEREKMHTFNRFYLLIGVITSFLIPLATITVQVDPIILPTTELFIEPVVENAPTTYVNEKISIDNTSIVLNIYLCISLLFLIRFGANLYKIIRKIKVNEKIKHQKAILVLVNDNILPHTFWNYIFINKKDYEDEKIEQELFTHELTHVTQKHTFDVLLIELLQIVFWINPLFIFLKKAIQLNHEFLADDTVIHQHKNTFQYQHLLLNKAAWKNDYYLASNLNYLITKKRLKMMTKQSSPIKIWAKKLAVIPLLAGFVFLFAERVEAQEVIVEEKEEPFQTIYEQVKKDNVETGFLKINDKNHFYVKIDKKTKFYNKEGKLVNTNGNIISNKKAKASTIIPDNYVTKTYFKGNVFCEFVDDKPRSKKELKEVLKEIKNSKEKFNIEEIEEEQINPNVIEIKEQEKYSKGKRSKIDQIIEFAKMNTKFYFNRKEVTSDKVIELLKKDKSLTLDAEASDFNSYKVWISKKNNNNSKAGLKNKLTDFEIKIEKKSDKIVLNCSYGCNWKELTFSLKEDRLLKTINQFGTKKEENKNSTFMFHLNYNFGRVELKSDKKGTAWIGLGFNLENTRFINQFGVNAQ